MPVKRRCSLRKLFNAIDADGSGEVTLAEVTKAFKKAAGKDEVLTFDEFSKMCGKSYDSKAHIIRALFKKLDTDGNGYVTVKEFFDEDKDGNGLDYKEFMKNFGRLSEEQEFVADTMFQLLAKDDGYISKKDFVAAAGTDKKLTVAEFQKIYNIFSEMGHHSGYRRGWRSQSGKTRGSAARGSDDDMAVIYQLFAKLDTDGNGYISIDEFFDEDKDGNGLSLEEFLKNFGSMTDAQLEVAKKLFKKIAKGDDTISREDFKAAAGDDEKLTKAELHKVYNANSGLGFRGSAARPFRGSAARPFRGSAARPFRGSAARPFRGSAARPFRGSAARPFRGSAARGGCVWDRHAGKYACMSW